ncbi:hypothetical protein ACFU3E_18430 [Streptomyces sp. NPDC057424]|uniref:hypothetical protein n=1 Tax=Streptomyces sp. NPDC057424 TaxID=3346127 RepID=UPI0036BB62A9
MSGPPATTTTWPSWPCASPRADLEQAHRRPSRRAVRGGYDDATCRAEAVGEGRPAVLPGTPARALSYALPPLLRTGRTDRAREQQAWPATAPGAATPRCPARPPEPGVLPADRQRGLGGSGESGRAREAAGRALAAHAGAPRHEHLSSSLRELRYREPDLLPGGIETVIGAGSTLRETVDLIMRDTGLAGLPEFDLQSGLHPSRGPGDSPVRTRRAGRERRVTARMDGAGRPHA